MAQLYRLFFLFRRIKKSKIHFVSPNRPVNVSELPQNSVYYQLLGDDASKLKFQWAEQGGTITADEDGNLNYFCYRVNPSVDYVPLDAAAAGGLGGEFLEITFPTDSDRGPIYVHYSQVYQPTDKARREMDLLTIVLGVIYQNSRFSTAQMEDLLAEADAINMKTAKLINLYQLFNGLQSQFGPDELHNRIIEMTWSMLSEFPKAGLPLPFKLGVVGVLPQLYCGFFPDSRVISDPDFPTGIHICLMAASGSDSATTKTHKLVEVEQAGDYEYHTLQDFVSIGRAIPGMYMIPGNIVCMSCDDVRRYVLNRGGGYPYDIATFDGMKKCLADGTSGATAIYEDNTYDNEFPQFFRVRAKIDETGAMAYYFLEDISKDILKSSFIPDYSTRAIEENGYMPLIETADQIITGQHSIFATCDDLKSYCDFIRSTGDSYSGKLSNVSSIISMANNDLQQSISAALNLIQKIEGAQRRTVSNVR